MNQSKQGLFAKFSAALSKTRTQIGSIGQVLTGKNELNEDILEDLRTQLLMADIGVTGTDRLMDNLQRRLKRKQLGDGEAALKLLRDQVSRKLDGLSQPFEIRAAKPFVILVVGVNGVGKTTTIGKLANLLKRQNLSVALAAGDTYRAAAIDQLKIWGERTSSTVIAQRPGSDSASVIYDAIESAAARNIDVVIADTAGRLQNKNGLMAELDKITRVVKRHDPEAPHETLLVLDAGVGQNAVAQVREFKQIANVSGLIVTKLDGSAKAGVIVGIAEEHSLPLYFVGLGEQQDDLQPFDRDAYVEGLFAN